MGEYVYGIDVTSIEERVSQMLRERGMTIATAESCTGGLIAKGLTDLPGSSEIFGFGTVTYANEAKTKLLGVPAELIEEKGAVCPEVAAAMAEGVRNLSGADIGLGITGIAGPGGGSEDKPVGLIYVGVSGEGGTRVEEFRLGTKTRTRTVIRKFAAARALNLVRKYLQQNL
jgi:nicotinamide-nucleotide amidase